ncbi:MAG: hypothetical protein IPN67_00230 [Bacteroidales bacterium]|nr:hypothetical protein [Bacteroidales bacterium]
MDEKEMRNIWQSYNERLESTMQVAYENVGEIAKIKLKSFLHSMKPFKVITIIIGILWVVFVDTLIINLWTTANLFFLISACIQTVLTKVAIGVYLYQLYLIYNVDLSEPVIISQERLSRLQFSTLLVPRILFLQLPAWTTFSWHTSMLYDGNIFLLTIQGVISILSVYASIWLFLNIRYENRNKKWFRWLFNGKEWDPIIESTELIRQIEEYKSEEINSTGAY